VPILPDGRDEPIARRARVRRRDQSGIQLSVEQRGIDPAGREQLIAGAHGEIRLAVAVLVLDELEHAMCRVLRSRRLLADDVAAP
jgi:hypothetical protein